MTAPGADPRTNVLFIDSRPNGTRAETLISVDGVDLLELQRPTHRPDGSLYPYGPFVYLPPDPVDLLPPDSANLLPTSEPHRAMVGICGCGHAGCGSLWLQVRRDRDQVIWEPSREPPGGSRSTIDTSYRFELLAYLDAVDAGQRSVATWEERPRLLARELRHRRDSLDGLTVGSSVDRTAGDVVTVQASPAFENIIVVVSPWADRMEIHLSVPDDRSDDEVIRGLQRLDPDVVGRWP
ncbi:hypothetical protein [Nakamurella lactea]|uniref:hypothetical protein n=1 Tax=Nakamurella lactea TaxID=459515 RepID=UPI000424AD03|nr:hypothetical protein [Nakamurella lactea]